jgi:DNA-binding transcriptional ArsR family regulator
VKSKQLDRVWKALSDRTRRTMMDLLAEKERTTGELAAAFPKLSRYAVMKHLSVLNRAGLLITRREGRLRWNQLNPVPLREATRRWLSRYEQVWADALINIRDEAERNEKEGKS